MAPLPSPCVEDASPITPVRPLSPVSDSSSESSGSDSDSPPLFGGSSRQVTKFKDVYCMVLPYCGTFEFEITEDFDYKEDCDTEDEEDTNHVANPRETLIKYVAQIRKSFGFDVDCVAPSWFQGRFVPFDMEEAKREYYEYYAVMLEAADVAVAEINSDLGGVETYKLVKLEKVVRGLPWKKLLTLRVKKVVDDASAETKSVDDDTRIIQALVYEDIGVGYRELKLIQWRFKPVEDDAWYEPPPLEDQYPWLKVKPDVAKDA